MTYPVGLIARLTLSGNFWRTVSSVWNKTTKDFILNRIKEGHPLNPIVIIDDTTKKATCVLPNSDLTGFEPYTDMLLCRRVETIADYMIKKVKIQKSRKSKEEKEKYILLNEKRNYKHEELETKDEKAFNKFVKELD